MTNPELVIKKGVNNAEYLFQILDENGAARDISTVNGSTGQVRLFIIDRFTRQTALNVVLTAVSLATGMVKLTATTSNVPNIGFYDGELWVENTNGDYSEPYREFPVVIDDARQSATADRSFESWP